MGLLLLARGVKGEVHRLNSHEVLHQRQRVVIFDGLRAELERVLLLRLTLIHKDASMKLSALVVDGYLIGDSRAISDVNLELYVSCRPDLALLILELLKVEHPYVTKVLAIVTAYDEHPAERLDGRVTPSLGRTVQLVYFFS